MILVKDFIKKNKNQIYMTLLIIAPLLSANQGIDFSDSGFMLTRYSQFSGSVSDMPTLLSNMFGNFLYETLNIQSLLMYKLVYSFVISITAILAWKFSIKYIDDDISFVGIISAIFITNYFPRVSGYINISVLILTASIILIHQGMINRSKQMILISGVLFGLNIFVRLPNLSYILIGTIALLFFETSGKNKLNYILYYTTGLLLSVIIIIALLALNGYLYNYVLAIRNMIIAGQGDSNHNVVKTLAIYSKQLFDSLSFGLIVIGFYCAFTIWKEKTHRTLLNRITLYVLMFCFLAVKVSGLLGQSRFDANNLIYSDIVGLTIISVIYYQFTSKEFGTNLYAFLCLSSFIITPLGSDGVIVYTKNNMFLMLPIFLSVVSQLTAEQLDDVNGFAKRMTRGVVYIAFFGYALYSATHVYRDYGIFNHYGVIENQKMFGMKTTLNKAEIVNQFLEEFSTIDTSQSKLIVYGSSPMLYYMLEMESPINSVWVELGMYSHQVFNDELYEIRNDKNIIIVTKSDMGFENWDTESAKEITTRNNQENPKHQILMSFINNYNYKVILDTEFATVYSN